MSKPIMINWPLSDNVAVCIAQPKAAAGALIINGTLASADTSQNRVATFAGIARTVSITSGGDVSGVHFTITGTLAGQIVSERRLGPDADTVDTTQLFNTVTSVTVDAALVANASVGTGLTGATNWQISDYFRPNMALSVLVNVTGTINYSFQTTFDDPAFVASPNVFEPIDGVTIPTVPAATPMSGATNSIVANYTIPTGASRININSSDDTGSLIIYFLQQGIR